MGRGWLHKIRVAVLTIGFGWLPVAVTFVAWNHGARAIDWMFVTLLFMLALFGVPAVILALIIPFQRGRIIAVPIFSFFLALSVFNASKSSFVPLEGAIWLTLYLATMVAISLLVPEIGFIRRFYEHWFGVGKNN